MEIKITQDRNEMTVAELLGDAYFKVGMDLGKVIVLKEFDNVVFLVVEHDNRLAFLNLDYSEIWDKEELIQGYGNKIAILQTVKTIELHLE